MNKQPMSAVQPVFEQVLWQKERLTHSQPREKPRLRKDTQQSWIKPNIDIASSDSKPMFFFNSFATDAEDTTSTKKRRVGDTSRDEPHATSLSIGEQTTEENLNGPSAFHGHRNQHPFVGGVVKH